MSISLVYQPSRRALGICAHASLPSLSRSSSPLTSTLRSEKVPLPLTRLLAPPKRAIFGPKTWSSANSPRLPSSSARCPSRPIHSYLANCKLGHQLNRLSTSFTDSPRSTRMSITSFGAFVVPSTKTRRMRTGISSLPWLSQVIRPRI